jgi:heterodisulfide reductase subunit B
MKYALFLGCTVPVRAQNYEISVRKIAQILDIELVDIEDFACCGYPVKSTDERTEELLAARNLAIASEEKLNICTLCSACTGVLTEVNNKIVENPEFKQEINNKLKHIGKEYKEPIVVKHFARLLYEDIGIDAIKEKRQRELSAVSVAVHYGCHYLKPSHVYKEFDNSEDPKSLDQLVELTGATVIDYETKKQCCGGAILGVEEDVSLKISGRKLNEVKEKNADALISICPFCSVMYEDNQKRIGSKFNTTYDIPVLFYPQILGLALGLEERELGFRMNKIKPEKLLSKL